MLTPFKKMMFIAAMVVAAGTAYAQTEARDLAVEQKNLALVSRFYDDFFNRHNIEAADIVAEGYIQHNPDVADGKEPFVTYFAGYFKENPESRAKIIRAATFGDFVYLHVHATNGTKDPLGQAVLDIFRVEDGKITEHWDVIQTVPAKALNKNTMF